MCVVTLKFREYQCRVQRRNGGNELKHHQISWYWSHIIARAPQAFQLLYRLHNSQQLPKECPHKITLQFFFVWVFSSAVRVCWQWMQRITLDSQTLQNCPSLTLIQAISQPQAYNRSLTIASGILQASQTSKCALLSQDKIWIYKMKN